MPATRCACGFERLADEELIDHLLRLFEPEDSTGPDGRTHLETTKQACSCGFSATTPEELNDHFLAVFVPPDHIGPDGQPHEPAA